MSINDQPNGSILHIECHSCIYTLTLTHAQYDKHVCGGVDCQLSLTTLRPSSSSLTFFALSMPAQARMPLFFFVPRKDAHKSFLRGNSGQFVLCASRLTRGGWRMNCRSSPATCRCAACCRAAWKLRFWKVRYAQRRVNLLPDIELYIRDNQIKWCDNLVIIDFAYLVM